MNPLTLTRLKTWSVVVVVFLLGCVTGASLDGVYRSRAEGEMQRDRKGDKFERLRRDLNLNDEQATRVRAILDETRDEYRRLRAEARPRYDEIRERGRASIRAVLTPEQQTVFDAKVAERDARHKDRERSER
jgi:Spy/CpxP family protein refolding chaperone